MGERREENSEENKTAIEEWRKARRRREEMKEERRNVKENEEEKKWRMSNEAWKEMEESMKKCCMRRGKVRKVKERKSEEWKYSGWWRCQICVWQSKKVSSEEENDGMLARRKMWQWITMKWKGKWRNEEMVKNERKYQNASEIEMKRKERWQKCLVKIWRISSVINVTMKRKKKKRSMTKEKK